MHLTTFPITNENLRDIELENKMSYARDISSLALSIRKKNMIKVRQPLNKLIVPVKNILEKKSIESVSKLICAEINVKKIEMIHQYWRRIQTFHFIPFHLHFSIQFNFL